MTFVPMPSFNNTGGPGCCICNIYNWCTDKDIPNLLFDGPTTISTVKNLLLVHCEIQKTHVARSFSGNYKGFHLSLFGHICIDSYQLHKWTPVTQYYLNKWSPVKTVCKTPCIPQLVCNINRRKQCWAVIDLLSRKQYGRIFAERILQCTFLKCCLFIFVDIAPNYAPKDSISNKLKLGEVTARCRRSYKAVDLWKCFRRCCCWHCMLFNALH